MKPYLKPQVEFKHKTFGLCGALGRSFSVRESKIFKSGFPSKEKKTNYSCAVLIVFKRCPTKDDCKQ